MTAIVLKHRYYGCSSPTWRNAIFVAAFVLTMYQSKHTPHAVLGADAGGSSGLSRWDSRSGGRWQLIVPEVNPAVKLSYDRYLQRSGGFKQAAGAIFVGGLGGTLALAELPVVGRYSTLIGMAGGAYAVQLPPGNELGEAAREAGRRAALMVDAITDTRNWEHM